MYRVVLSERATSELEDLPDDVAERLWEAIERPASWPNHGRDVRELSGPFKGLWRVPVGGSTALSLTFIRGGS